MPARTLLTITGEVSDTYAIDTTNGVTWPFPLGSRYEETPGTGTNRDPATDPSVVDRGSRIWLFVYNDSGSAIAAKTLVARKASEQKYYVRAAPVACPLGLLCGVSVHEIPNGEAGWIVCDGFVEVTADDTTAITANTSLGVGTGGVAGRVQSVGATAANIGWATEAALVNANATAEIHLLH